jgi:hypothetical protein
LHAWLGLCTTVSLVVISEAARRQRSLSHRTLTRTHARLHPSYPHASCGTGTGEVARWVPDSCARMMEGADLSGRAFSETCAKRFGPAAGIFHSTRFPCMSPVASYLTSECLRLARSTPTPGSGDYAPCLCLWLVCRPLQMSRCCVARGLR